MKKYVFLFTTILLFIISLPTYSFPIWQRKVINYEKTQYKAGFQNWMITQAENGWIYCANSDGLLEYDGVNWSLYGVRNKIVRSVKIVGSRIYIGGSSEFGYFEPNEMGELKYKSLSIKVKNWGGEVWNILLNNDDYIYFLSDRHIHIYDKKSDTVTSIYANVKIESSTLFRDILYIGSPDGLYTLTKNNTLKLLDKARSVQGKRIRSLIVYDEKMLVTTAESGIYSYDEKEFLKIHSIADTFIEENQIFSASLTGSKMALGSVQNGVFVFDLKNPAYKETFNLEKGLKNNTILSAFFDRDQNLWLGLDKGIGYIDLNSPIRPLFATLSPIGTGYCSIMYNNELYLGTNQALYKVDRKGDYHLVNGSEGQIWSLAIIDNSLFVSGDNGVIVITPAETYKINLAGVWEIHPLSADKNRLIAGTYSGFAILEKVGGKWHFFTKTDDFSDSVRGFIEDEENYTFWTVNQGTEIRKVSFSSDFSKVTNRKVYTLKEASFDQNVIFRIIDNALTICATDGIYMYSRITDSFDHYTQLESMLEGQAYYEYLTLDEKKNIWFVVDKNLKILPFHNGEYKSKIYNWGLSNELIDTYQNVYLADSATAIVAVENGFLKIDLSQKEKSTKSINTSIQALTNSKNDSILGFGNASKVAVLPYSVNSIKIHFAATDFSQTSEILYSYRLKGQDEEWSIPTPNNTKEYTNLSEGKYTFEVKAFINGNSEATNTAVISFTINPPWYRTSLAYSLYFILIVSLLLILYKKTISKQKKIILQKGEELIAQTKRHEEETKLKDQEIYELQNKNLKTELTYKTQEMNGYILNIIRKNEMLEDVKKTAINISKAIDEEKETGIIKQRVMRLITQINSNIDHDVDFKVFQSNFDIVHQDFFKQLDERFPNLSRNDKVLCAYLKMNLSSKEIAPLLNITVRGVEVNRYRLRKKMNLDRDINLSEYLQTLEQNSNILKLEKTEQQEL